VQLIFECDNPGPLKEGLVLEKSLRRRRDMSAGGVPSKPQEGLVAQACIKKKGYLYPCDVEETAPAAVGQKREENTTGSRGEGTHENTAAQKRDFGEKGC